MISSQGAAGLREGLNGLALTLAFNELNKDAADSFAANFPNAMRFDGDLRTALSNKDQGETCPAHRGSWRA